MTPLEDGKLNPGVESWARHKKQKVQRHGGMKMPVMPEEQPMKPEHGPGEKDPGLMGWFRSVCKTLLSAVEKRNFSAAGRSRKALCQTHTHFSA